MGALLRGFGALTFSGLGVEAERARTLAEPSGQTAVTNKRHCQDDVRDRSMQHAKHSEEAFGRNDTGK